jgi:hypothetical protein
MWMMQVVFAHFPLFVPNFGGLGKIADEQRAPGCF